MIEIALYAPLLGQYYFLYQ